MRLLHTGCNRIIAAIKLRQNSTTSGIKRRWKRIRGLRRTGTATKTWIQRKIDFCTSMSNYRHKNARIEMKSHLK